MIHYQAGGKLRQTLVKFAVLLGVVLVAVAGTSLAAWSSAVDEPRFPVRMATIALSAMAVVSLMGAAVTARRSIVTDHVRAPALRRALNLALIGRWTALTAVACGIAGTFIDDVSTVLAWLGIVSGTVFWPALTWYIGVKLGQVIGLAGRAGHPLRPAPQREADGDKRPGSSLDR